MARSRDDVEKRRVRNVLLGCLLVLVWAGSAPAHPHVWVDCEVTPEFDAEGLVGFRQQWFLDEMFSTNIVVEALGEAKVTFSAEDQQIIKSYGFDNLKNFNYFTDIRIEGRPFEVAYATDFSCTFQDGKLVYSFFVPCRVAATATPKKVDIGIYDLTFYTDLYMTQCNEAAAAGLNVDCAVTDLEDVMLEVVGHAPKGFEVEFSR